MPSSWEYTQQGGNEMNYMKQVAEMLGLEWDDEKQESEEFKINTEMNCLYKLWIKNRNLEIAYFSLNDGWTSSQQLGYILSGFKTIVKKYWKPKKCDNYFYVNIDHAPRYKDSIWHDDNFDNLRYELGLVFRTKEEAISKAEQIIKMLKESEG